MPIEEPAVVADDHRAAGERQQRLLERAQRVDVEVVGRLVEQQQVRAALEQLRQVDAIALAARQRPDLALLVAPLEVEPGHVGARRDGALAELDLVVPAGDLFPDRLVGAKRVARLIDVADLHRLAEPQRAGVGLLPVPVIIRNSVVLPAPFGPITPTIPPRGSVKFTSSISS